MNSKARIVRSTAALAAVLLLSASSSIAEVDQKGSLKVSFAGKVRPKKLPRTGEAPIAVSLSGEIKTTDQSTPPQLREIVLQINRQGRIDTEGLPVCKLDQIDPATTEDALANCSRALVGEGSFKASVALPDQSPFPSNGKVVAFNGRQGGKQVVFAHIYGREPLPTSYVLPFVLRRQGKGPYAATFTAGLPQIAADWGYVSGISLTLRRSFRRNGERHSYLSAGCPAPRGFRSASFPFARASFAFEDGRTLASVLTRRCGVRG